MKKYVAAAKNVEVTGYAFSSIVTNVLSDEIKPVLEKYGFAKLELEAWYPQQMVLDALLAIHDHVGDSLALVAVGRQVIDAATLPPEIITFEQGVNAISMIHDMNHRNLPEGVGIFVEKLGEHHLQVTNATPYPDDLIYGYLYSIINRFAPEKSHPSLKYNNTSNINSDENMVYDITY